MNHNLLIVQPPMHHPARPNVAGLRAQLLLEDMGQKAAWFDAGLDFYYQFLLSPDRLIQAMILLRHRICAGELDQADVKTRDLGQGVLTQEPLWRSWIEELPQAVSRLQSDAFFDLSHVAADLRLLDRLLALVSAAYYPSRFSRHGFHHPGLNDFSDVAAFTNDPQLNPFLQYGNIAYPYSANIPAADVVMLLMTAAGQVAPAAGLLTTWRRKKPNTVYIAAGHAPWVEAVHAAAGIDPAQLLQPDVLRVWEDFQGRWNTEAGPSPAEASPPPDKLSGPFHGHPNLQVYPLQTDAMQQVVDSVKAEKEKTMVWQAPRGDLKTITAHLYTIARQGHWNHLVLPEQTDHPLTDALIKFAGVNPNIIHSWCRRGGTPSHFSDPLYLLPEGSARYGETAALPGVPLWQVLRDPVYIDAYRQRLGAKTLIQLRMDLADAAVYEIGQQLIYHFVKPEELPEGYLDEICRMVEAGGSVGTQFLRYNLERAFLITYVEEHGVIVGNSSLKHPRQEYIEAVSAQSGLDLHNYLERGYTSVRPEYRGFGIGAKLLEGLTERAAGYKIFSIIGEDNIATQKMAIRNRTRKVAAFMSQKAGKQVGVWIPEWMLPEGITLPPQPDFAVDPEATRIDKENR